MTTGEVERLAAIYARISLDKNDEGAGVERQIQECSRIVEAKGWALVETFVDNSISAMSGAKRPRFEALVEAIRDGRVDTIVVWHIDRLVRRTADLLRVFDLGEVCETLRIEFVRGSSIEVNDASGKLTASILTSVAQFESEHKAERVRSAARRRAERGELLRTPELLDRPEVVLAVFETFIRTESISEAHRRRLDLAPDTSPSRHATRTLLESPWVAGIVTYRGAELVGVEPQWTPAVEVGTFRRAQAILARPSRLANRHERGPIHRLGSGLFLCGVCGAPVIASAQAGTKAYKCPDHHISRASEPVDVLAFWLVERRLAQVDAWTPLLPRDEGVDDERVEELTTRRAALAQRHADVSNLVLDGLLDAVLARKRLAEFVADISALDAEIASLASPPPAEVAPYDVSETLRVLPLDAFRRVAGLLFTLELFSQRGGPRTVGPRPPRPGSFRVTWHDDIPERVVKRAVDVVPEWVGLEADPPEWFRSSWVTPGSGGRVMTQRLRREVWSVLAPFQTGTGSPSPFVIGGREGRPFESGRGRFERPGYRRGGHG